MTKRITKVELGYNDPMSCNTIDENGNQTSACLFLNLEWAYICPLFHQVLLESDYEGLVVERCPACIAAGYEVNK